MLSRLITTTDYLLIELLGAFSILAALAASIHVILRRGENKSAIGWLGLFWLGYPLIGSLIYLLVGVNSIRREKRASGQSFLGKRRRRRRPHRPTSAVDYNMPAPANVQMVTLKKMGDRILGHRLSRGDDVRLLVGGSQAYPAMLQAIEGATRSIAMASYIFKDDPAGQRFVDALDRAMKRGVQVRVLIDFMGSSHGGRSVYRLLAEKGIPARRFMPSLALPFIRYANLRNHRKLLVVDGSVGFTGGMNVDVAFWPELRPADVTPKDDTHFLIRGPVLADLVAAFEQDWRFTTGESLDGETWAVSPELMGNMHARGMLDGPDSDTRLTHGMILAALATSKHSVKIITPYFLPPSDIISAMGVAAVRGVKIELLVPDPTNSRMVQWASVDFLQQVMEMGVKVWADGGDFNHSKLMLVDGSWVMFGSSNWDPRSLRLNFEFNAECHSAELAAQAEAYWQSQIAGARQWKPPEELRKSLLLNLRDGIARLFVPVL